MEKHSDRKFYEKNLNPITGDRIVTKERGRDNYEKNYDKIKWGVRSEQLPKQ